MALETEAVLPQIDAALERCGASVHRPFPPTEPPRAGMIGPSRVAGNAVEMSSACLAAIERLAPGSSYAATAHGIAQGKGALGATATVKALIRVLVALRRDVEAGYTRTLQEFVHAEVFADFLEMADELLRTGYKDAAAVITGSVSRRAPSPAPDSDRTPD